jgi:hypothetical protein
MTIKSNIPQRPLRLVLGLLAGGPLSSRNLLFALSFGHCDVWFDVILEVGQCGGLWLETTKPRQSGEQQQRWSVHDASTIELRTSGNPIDGHGAEWCCVQEKIQE